MGILTTLGFTAPAVEQRQTSSAAPAIAIPPSRSDITFSVDQALSVGAVCRAVQIICTNVSQMSLVVRRNGEEIQAPSLITQPQVGESLTGFIEETTFALCTFGNAYWRIIRNNQGQPSSLISLDPNSVTIMRKSNRKGFYIGTEEVSINDIKHLKIGRRPGHDYGYSPLQTGRQEIAGAIRLREFVDCWFDTRNVPAGILTTDQQLNAEQARQYQEAWKQFLKENGTAVLGQGMRYEGVSLNPKDAQMVDVQRESVKGIARLFGIPSLMLLSDMGASNTYSNTIQETNMFLTNTLTRYMTEIENAFASLLPRGTDVQFNEESLLRMSPSDKWAVINAQIQAGYTDGNELRALEGKAPLNTTERSEDA